MNTLATIRNHLSTWASSVLSLFVIAWLSMIILPCTMAMDSPSDHVFTDMQSTEIETQYNHSEHGHDGHSQDNHDATGNMHAQSDSTHDCPRCLPDGNEQHCGADDVNCSSLDNYDNRVNQKKLDDNQQNNSVDDYELSLVIFDSALSVRLSTLKISSRCFNSLDKPLSSGTPLNVLYCVYLI
ncbi:MAG: hypothetical protein KJO88_05405 [Gammaproteobacteria bacterium]|nr:hypothetical protein [Gammaproteobacteria bacterium]